MDNARAIPSTKTIIVLHLVPPIPTLMESLALPAIQDTVGMETSVSIVAARNKFGIIQLENAFVLMAEIGMEPIVLPVILLRSGTISIIPVYAQLKPTGTASSASLATQDNCGIPMHLLVSVPSELTGINSHVSPVHKAKPGIVNLIVVPAPLALTGTDKPA